MIVNAANSKINLSGGIPNVEGTLSDWFKTMKIGVTVKTVVDFQLSETINYVDIQAVLQPFTTKQLQLKPEGQRSWNWETLHVKGTDQEFCLDDHVYIDGMKYRIMQKFEWQRYGFLEYQIIQDFGKNQSASISDNMKVTEAQSYDP